MDEFKQFHYKNHRGRDKGKHITREIVNEAVKEYLKNGGTITKLEPTIDS